MEREKTQSKQQRKEIPTKQGPYSFFQSQVQGPAGRRPAEGEQPVPCSWLQRDVWTPSSEPTLPVRGAQGAFSPPHTGRQYICSQQYQQPCGSQGWDREGEQSEMFLV